MTRLLVLASFFVLASPALSCEPVADRSLETSAVLERIQKTKDPVTANNLSSELWAIWTDAPDSEAQALLDRGMEQRRTYDFAGAVETLDKLVEYCPDYAEGWNQRAFAKFLQLNYDEALEDLDRALEINPQHVAAMSGKALTLMGMGRPELAQSVLRDALELNPWLPERRYLVEKPGQDI